MIDGRSAAGSAGQSLLEFALTLPLLLLLTVGILDFGLAVWHHSTLAGAVREGTRYALVHGSDSSNPAGPGSASYSAPDRDSAVEAVVQGYAFGMAPNRLTVSSTWPDGTNNAGSRVTVQASYHYVPLTTMILGGLPIALGSSSTSIIQY